METQNDLALGEQDITALSYEDAVEKLESLLQVLEKGELSLEESLSLYEQGAALTSHCERKLDEAELRVRQWQPEAEPTDFTDWQDESE